MAVAGDMATVVWGGGGDDCLENNVGLSHEGMKWAVDLPLLRRQWLSRLDHPSCLFPSHTVPFGP